MIVRVATRPFSVLSSTTAVYRFPFATVTGRRSRTVQSAPRGAAVCWTPTRVAPSETRVVVPTVVPAALFAQNERT